MDMKTTPAVPAWTAVPGYTDILYSKADEGIAKVAINRPEVRNAFRPETVAELQAAFTDARNDANIGVVILTGQGKEAFCSGGDQRVRGKGGYVGGDGVPRLNVLDLQRQIRTLPKPVVAMVAGYAIGGGHVLHMVCDITIAADNARFGQTGPRVGSFDGGYGASYMARIVGQKKAREIWFLCRQYDAQQALEMGLVNCVVPVRAARGGNGAVVPRDARQQPDRAALPEGRAERRLRRPGRAAGTGRQRDAAVLPVGRGPGRPECLRREAQAGLPQVPRACPEPDERTRCPSSRTARRPLGRPRGGAASSGATHRRAGRPGAHAQLRAPDLRSPDLRLRCRSGHAVSAGRHRHAGNPGDAIRAARGRTPALLLHPR